MTKLKVNTSGDRFEQEAERIADQLSSMREPGLREDDATNGPRKVLPTANTEVTGLLHSPGRPLDDRERDFFEPRLGMDLGRVRVHDDGEAARTVESVHARAFTVGNHIAIGAGQGWTMMGSDQRLLAHELVHVAQQGGGGGVSPVGASGPTLQREEVDSLGTVGDAFLNAALAASPFPGPLTAPIGAAVRGFIAESKAQVGANKEVIKERFDEGTKPSNLIKLFGGLQGGLVAGALSPITGLFDMLVFAEKLWQFVTGLGAQAGSKFAAIYEEGKALAEEFAKAVGAIKEKLTPLKEHPIDTVVSLLESGASGIETVANKAGHEAARAVISAIEKPFEKPEAKAEGTEEKGVLASAEASIEAFKEKLFSTPWSKIGYEIGSIVGSAVVNVLLLIFTGGVGSALTKLGQALGELGGVLGNVGKLVQVLGKVIGFVEFAIDKVMSVVLKPIQPLMRALEPALGRLRGFLRKLLGLAEEEATTVASTAAKSAAHVEPKVPARAPAPMPVAAKPVAPPAPRPAPKAPPESNVVDIFTKKPLSEAEIAERAAAQRAAAPGPRPTEPASAVLPKPQEIELKATGTTGGPVIQQTTPGETAPRLEVVASGGGGTKTPTLGSVSSGGITTGEGKVLAEPHGQGPGKAAAEAGKPALPSQAETISPRARNISAQLRGLSPEQVEHVERLLTEMEQAGGDVAGAEKKILGYLRKAKAKGGNLDSALKNLEADFRRAFKADDTLEHLFPPETGTHPPEGTRDVGGTTRPRTRRVSPSRALGAEYEAETGLAIAPGHDRHHIVPDKAGGELGDRLREILDEVGIPIYDRKNAIPLPSPRLDRPKLPLEALTSHGPIHTERYFRELLNELEPVAGDFDLVSAKLAQIESRLREGTFPY